VSNWRIKLGNQTITFVSLAPGATDELGTHTMVETTVDVAECLHAPVSASERMLTAEYREVGAGAATMWWKSACPPVPAALNAQPSDVIRVGGVTYQIIGGAAAHTDFDGTVTHVSFLSERQAVAHD